jgi:hypothetical protein
MRRTLTKQVLIGFGSPVLLADLGFAVSGYPWLVTKHPLLLWMVGVVSGILIIIGFLLPREQEQDARQPALINNNKQKFGPVTGGSASATRGSSSARGNHVTVNVNNPVPGLPPKETPQSSQKFCRLIADPPFRNCS